MLLLLLLLPPLLQQTIRCFLYIFGYKTVGHFGSPHVFVRALPRASARICDSLIDYSNLLKQQQQQKNAFD